MAPTRKKAKKDKGVVTYSDQVEHYGPGLILFYNFHHAHIDCFNLVTRKVLSEQMCLTTQENINHLTFIESTFFGSEKDVVSFTVDENGEEIDMEEELPMEKMQAEAAEALQSAEAICNQFDDEIHTLVFVCDFQYLVEIDFFQEVVAGIDYLKDLGDRIKIMSTATAAYLPYFYDVGISDFDIIPEDVYISLIRQGSHRTDALLLRRIDGQFKVVNMINRFKERGFNEEETIDLVDNLRTIQNNVLTECFAYILELKKTSSFPVFKKVLDGKNVHFLQYEPVRSEIVDKYFDRMGVDLDIYAEKDDEQQKLSGRYAVTMQGNLKQISNQQRFIDKSRYPLKRAPAIPGKRMNYDPYAETSMSPLQYIRFLRAAKTLPLEKQPRRVREQVLEAPGSPDESPPMDVVEAMCADQIEKEAVEEEECLNFDDAWLEKYGEEADAVVHRKKFEKVPVIKRVLRLKKSENEPKIEPTKNIPFIPPVEVKSVENDPPEEDDIPEACRRIRFLKKQVGARKMKVRQPKPAKRVGPKVAAAVDRKRRAPATVVKAKTPRNVEKRVAFASVEEEPQPGPSRILEPQVKQQVVVKTEHVGGEQMTEQNLVVDGKRSRKRPGRPSTQQKLTEDVKKPADKEAEKPKLRRSTRAAAKTATAKIAIAHMPLKGPPSGKGSARKKVARKPKKITINGRESLKLLFPHLAQLEKKDWPYEKEITFEDTGYDEKYIEHEEDDDFTMCHLLFEFFKHLKFVDGDDELDTDEDVEAGGKDVGETRSSGHDGVVVQDPINEAVPMDGVVESAQGNDPVDVSGPTAKPVKRVKIEDDEETKNAIKFLKQFRKRIAPTFMSMKRQFLEKDRLIEEFHNPKRVETCDPEGWQDVPQDNVWDNQTAFIEDEKLYEEILERERAILERGLKPDEISKRILGLFNAEMEQYQELPSSADDGEGSVGDDWETTILTEFGGFTDHEKRKLLRSLKRVKKPVVYRPDVVDAEIDKQFPDLSPGYRLQLAECRRRRRAARAERRELAMRNNPRMKLRKKIRLLGDIEGLVSTDEYETCTDSLSEEKTSEDEEVEGGENPVDGASPVPPYEQYLEQCRKLNRRDHRREMRKKLKEAQRGNPALLPSSEEEDEEGVEPSEGEPQKEREEAVNEPESMGEDTVQNGVDERHEQLHKSDSMDYEADVEDAGEERKEAMPSEEDVRERLKTMEDSQKLSEEQFEVVVQKAMNLIKESKERMEAEKNMALNNAMSGVNTDDVQTAAVAIDGHESAATVAGVSALAAGETVVSEQASPPAAAVGVTDSVGDATEAEKAAEAESAALSKDCGAPAATEDVDATKSVVEGADGDAAVVGETNEAGEVVADGEAAPEEPIVLRKPFLSEEGRRARLAEMYTQYCDGMLRSIQTRYIKKREKPDRNAPEVIRERLEKRLMSTWSRYFVNYKKISPSRRLFSGDMEVIEEDDGITVENGSHFNFLNKKPGVFVKRRDVAKCEKHVKELFKYYDFGEDDRCDERKEDSESDDIDMMEEDCEDGDGFDVDELFNLSLEDDRSLDSDDDDDRGIVKADSKSADQPMDTVRETAAGDAGTEKEEEMETDQMQMAPEQEKAAETGSQNDNSGNEQFQVELLQ